MINSVESLFLVEKHHSIAVTMIDIKCPTVSGFN